MEELNRKTIDRAVLVGLNADCFTKEETATETTLDELEALLNTAGGRRTSCPSWPSSAIRTRASRRF